MDTLGSTAAPGWRTNLALTLSIVSIVVSALAYSDNIFGFFGQVTPAHSRVRQANVRLYLEAMADPGLNKLYEATHVVEEDSPAESYIESIYWMRNARVARTKYVPDTGHVLQEGDTWKNCYDDANTDCVTFNGFEFNKEDKIVQARRNDRLLSAIAVKGNGDGDDDGLMVSPLGGRTLGSTEYALRLRNTTADPVTVLGCDEMYTETGGHLLQTNEDGWPVKVLSWQEADFYCSFDGDYFSTPQYVALRVKRGHAEIDIWATFERP